MDHDQHSTHSLHSDHSAHSDGLGGGNHNGIPIKVDTASILASIKEIEVRLTEVARQDKIPPWAAAFTSRLQHIEEHHLYLHRALSTAETNASIHSANGPRPHSPASTSPVKSVNIHDLTNEERVVSKIRYDVDSQVNSAKSTLEAHISSLNLEVERLHKLISIRPTVSDLQQVALSVNEVGRKIHLFSDDISSTIRVTVKEKVAEEMETIMEHVKNHNLINEGGINNILKKIEYNQKDMTTMREAVESGLESVQFMLDNLSGQHNQVADALYTLRDEFHGSKETADKQLVILHESSNTIQTDFSGFREKVVGDLAALTEQLGAQKHGLERGIKMADTKAEQANAAIIKTNNGLADLRTLHECDIEGLVEKTAEMHKTIENLRDQHLETEKFVNSLHEINGIAMILEHQQKLTELAEVNERTIEDIAAVNRRVDGVFDGVSGIEETLLSNGKLVTDQAGRIDRLQEEGRKSNARITVLESLLENAHDKIENLLALRDDVALITELIKAESLSGKQTQLQVKQLQEASEDHDSRIETLISSMERVDDDHQKALEDIKNQITDTMTERQAVMDAAIQNIRENLTAITAADDVSKRSNPKKTGGRGSLDSTAQSSKGGSINNDEDDRPHPPIPMTNEERHKSASYYAKFIADLCVNYEEISIRKTFVPEIPPTMCEHITATAQTVTAQISNWTDAEFIQKLLRDGPGDNEADYHEDAIKNRRQEKLDEFAAEIVNHIVANNTQPGIIRMEAREKFIKQLKRALNTAMSKHDQVLIVGNSRFGRMKIPSCIACDRPLLDKVCCGILLLVYFYPLKPFSYFFRFAKMMSCCGQMTLFPEDLWRHPWEDLLIQVDL
jgi:Asp-tRNA(Asn)/Glu-tRNA(Gln) amidotransferase C subunit